MLPENVVPESTRIYLTATGDAMGSVLNNLDKLVQQPTGCGEQNMVKFAPIVSVVEYLRGTNQISDEMDALTKNYLKIGNYIAWHLNHLNTSIYFFIAGIIVPIDFVLRL